MVQSTLQVLTGLEWIAYTLVKEIAWGAVETAFCMDEVTTWEEWGLPEDDREAARVVQVEACGVSGEPSGLVSECGTSQTKIIDKRANKNKKKKLPGLSASQKSVADFFSKTDKQILPTDTVPDVVCVDSEEYSVWENSLKKEYRFVRAARLKLPWSYGMNRLCVYKCGASSEQCGVFAQSDVQRV